jgi:hypothetical protein
MRAPDLPWVLQALLPSSEPPTFYPELVAQLEEAEFLRLGALHARFHSLEDREELVMAYSPDIQDALRRSTEVPETVLVAPDAGAFVGVDWFFGQPSVRLRTLLADDTVVETQRAWDHLPPWPAAGQQYVQHLRLRPEQDHSARGRQFTIVEGDDLVRLWEVHRAQVGRSRTGPRDHRTIDQAALLWGRLMHHDMRCEARAVAWGRPFGLQWKLRYATWLRPGFKGGW